MTTCDLQVQLFDGKGEEEVFLALEPFLSSRGDLILRTSMSTSFRHASSLAFNISDEREMRECSDGVMDGVKKVCLK